MKKFLATLLLLATMLPFAAKADELTVYNGTAYSSAFPFYVYYGDAMATSQWIMPAADLTAMNGASIQQLTFYIYSTQPADGNTWQLYMMETTQTTLSGLIDYSGATKVFEGTIDCTGATLTITLSTPFAYNGGNLFFCSRNVAAGNYKGVYWYGESNHTGASYVNYQYKGGGVQNFLPKTTFTYMVSTGLEVTPLDLGYRPNGAWMEPVELEVAGGVYTISAMDMDNEYFDFGDVHVPFATPTTMNVTTGTAEAGTVTGNLSFFYDGSKDLKTFELTANAYDPVTPDVWEMAQVVSNPVNYTNTPDYATLYNNYNLPGEGEEGNDAVYKVTFDEAKLLTANVGEAANGKVALYTEDFNGEGGPMATNAYTYEGPQIGPGPVNLWFNGYNYTGNNTWYGTSSAGSGMIFGYRIPASVLEEHGIQECSITSVVAAAREAYPYDLIIWRGVNFPETPIYYQQMGSNPTPLYFFQMDLDEPVYANDETLWITFQTDSPYAAYCGKYPINTADGRILYSFTGGESWYASSSYTPIIEAHFLELPTGREFTMNLADLTIREGSESALEEIEGTAIGETPSQRIARVKSEMQRGLGEGEYVQPGTYYIAASATEGFTVNINAETAPLPVKASNYDPADEQTGVEDPYLASWTIGNYTDEMQVLVGSQYPPQTALIDWTSNLVESAWLTNLEPNTSYFMQVNERNANGTTYGDVIGFVTAFEKPMVTVAEGEIYPGEAAELSWEMDRSFRGYNVYVDDVKVNTELIVDDEYAVEGLTRGTHNINVTAVYDEGESGYSNTVVVDMMGEGTVAGTVYEIDGSTPIEGVAVNFIGTDRFGNTQTFVFTTAANGAYTGDVYEGTYEPWAILDGYTSTYYGQEVTVEYLDVITGINFSMREELVPVGQVNAEETEAGRANVWWDWNPAALVEDFEHDGEMPEGWNQVGSYGWVITTNSPYEGTYCLKSNNAGVNSSTAGVEITVEVPYDGKMSFYIKPSSETSWDKGYFYIDGAEKCTVTGAGSWGKKEFNVSEGTHTYKWTYTKDSSVGSNDDCIYLDYVTLYEQIEPEPPFAGGWIYYDDGTYASSVGAGGTVYWGIAFAANSAYAGCTLNKINYYAADQGSGSITLNIYTGGESAPGTLVSTQDFSITSGAGWTEVTLNTPVTLTGTEQLWITCYNSGITYPASACAYVGEPLSCQVSTDGATWAPVTNYSLSYSWMLRGYLTAADGTSFAIGTAEVAPQNIVMPELTFNGETSIGAISAKVAETPIYTGVPEMTRGENGTRSFQKYHVYRKSVLDDADPVSITQTTDTCYLDNSYSGLAAGVYMYGVSAIYNGNREAVESEITWSNTVDHNMVAAVDFTATTNNGQSVAGTVVTFTNNVENYVYEETLDETGFVAFEDFRCGYYTLDVVKDGYQASCAGDIEIFEDMSIECLLSELISPAENLWVSQTGWVKWDAIGGDVPTPQPGGDPQWLYYDNDTYSSSVGAGGTVYWGVVFPDMSEYANMSLTKLNYYDAGQGAGSITANIYLGGTSAPGTLVSTQNFSISGSFGWVEVALNTPVGIDGTQPLWITCYNSGISYPASGCDYTGSANGCQVSTDGATWAPVTNYGLNYTWMLRGYVDNAKGESIALKPFVGEVSTSPLAATEPVEGNRGALYSIVKLNGVVAGQPTTNYFQLDETGLVDGQEYTVEVASMYASGMSEWRTATFTYRPSDPYYKTGVKNFAAETENADVTLSFELPGSTGAGDEFSFGFDNDLEGWTNIDNDGDGHMWYHSTEAGNHGTAAVTSHSGAGHVMGESYCNASWAALTPDDYFVTPQQYHIGSSSVLSFWCCAQDASYAAEHFGVAISEGSNTSASDFTTIQEWTLTAKTGFKGPRAVDGTREGSWYEFTCDLSEYAGSDAWIAIRHFNCSDQFILLLDDVTMGNAEAKGNREMWDLLADFEGTSGYQYGVCSDGENIYTSSWSASSTSQFYKYDMEGNFIEEFNVSGSGQCRDMTYDGEYFYGVANSSTVYCLDLANKTLVSTFSTSYGAMRGITYDSERDGFWVIGNWSGDLTLIDRTGAIVTVGPTPESASGLAYFNDPDGDEHVYCFNNGDNGVYDYNITTNTLGSTAVFNYSSAPGYASGGSSGGCHVGTYGDKTAFFGDMQQSPQYIAIYELCEAATPIDGGYLGAYIFRDGELITPEPLTRSPYVDENVAEGEHVYTARLVYGNAEYGTADSTWYAMSIPSEVTVEVEIECIPVEELEATAVYNEDGTYGVQLEWICTGAEVQGYKVYRNDSYIGMTTNMEYYDERTNNPGDYTYGVVAVYAYCEAEMVEAEVNVDAIGENSVIGGMYPNPTTGVLNIDAAAMQQITVVNALGQVVYNSEVSGDNTTIDMSVFGAGVYMVTVRTENGTSVQRVTVMK